MSGSVAHGNQGTMSGAVAHGNQGTTIVHADGESMSAVPS